MKMDERHLTQLAAVVQYGSVSKGAAALGMTQPAVSRTISHLENRLGQKLFEPGRKPLRATPLGHALALQGQSIHAASRKASQVYESFQAGKTGAVRVGGTPYFMDGIISTMIAGFQTNYPEIRVDQSYGYFTTLREDLLADRIDLAICPIDLLEEDSPLTFTEVLPGRNVIACANTHPLLGRKPASAESLQAYPWVAPPPGSPLYSDLREALYASGAQNIKIRYSGASLGAVLNYLRSSDALAVLPHSVVFTYRQQASIAALTNTIQRKDRALGLMRLRTAQPLPPADHLADHIEMGLATLRRRIDRHARL